MLESEVFVVKLESNHHSVFLMHYHLVLVVKYRRKVFDDEISDRAREIFEYIAPNYDHVGGMELVLIAKQ